MIIGILCGLTEILSQALIQRDLLIYIDNTWSVDPGIDTLTWVVKYTGGVW